MSIAVVNETDKFTGGFGATVITDAISHTAGNPIVATVSWAEDASFSSDITSITNTAGDTFVPAASRFQWNTNNYFQQWYCAASLGDGSDVVTVNFNGVFGAFNRGVAVIQLSDADASPFDDSGTGSDTSGTTASTDTIIVSGNAIIIAVVTNPFSSLTVGSGYTGAVFADTTTLLYEYKIVSASEAATAGCANANWGIIGSSWKEAGAGSSGWGPLLGQQRNRLVRGRQPRERDRYQRDGVTGLYLPSHLKRAA